MLLLEKPELPTAALRAELVKGAIDHVKDLGWRLPELDELTAIRIPDFKLRGKALLVLPALAFNTKSAEALVMPPPPVRSGGGPPAPTSSGSASGSHVQGDGVNPGGGGGGGPDGGNGRDQGGVGDSQASNNTAGAADGAHASCNHMSHRR